MVVLLGGFLYGVLKYNNYNNNVTNQRVSSDNVSSVLNVPGIGNRDAGQYTCTAFSTASCTVPSTYTETEKCFSQNASRTVNINIIGRW